MKGGHDMTSKSLRTASGMTQKEFSEFLSIPVRTIENWDSGATTPPAYVLDLIRYKLEKEGRIPASDK